MLLWQTGIFAAITFATVGRALTVAKKFPFRSHIKAQLPCMSQEAGRRLSLIHGILEDQIHDGNASATTFAMLELDALYSNCRQMLQFVRKIKAHIGMGYDIKTAEAYRKFDNDLDGFERRLPMLFKREYYENRPLAERLKLVTEKLHQLAKESRNVRERLEFRPFIYAFIPLSLFIVIVFGWLLDRLVIRKYTGPIRVKQ